ncbi:PREDICTED: uncharacterized protein LOC104819947 isoform X2 [Tarenaya hassleriana]|uniref:uncharacterized protein LOC104819947 isoform X2 n=1 Tax=Tarenaya hassleriana TaxID=28532 RepID=UPI00053CA677|nr:PREDICTED: uncharacterized protein LOC104819947 isoform X2 [Tarenaya hassleriana]
MDFENSGFSEAGESGWTTYLDYSSSSIHRFDSFINGGRNLAGDDEYEVDLSMVSDASSGPRFYCEDVEEFLQEDVYCSKNKNKKEHEGQQHRRRFYSCLDDTASSLYAKNIHGLRNEVSRQQAEEFSQRTFKENPAANVNLDFFQASRNGKLALDHLQGTNDKRKRRGAK